MAFLPRTPYERIRYPSASSVVAVGDVQAMANDVDQALVTSGVLGADFSRLASVTVKRAAAQSITKGTLTAITMDTVLLNNGADSPWANANWWAAGQPTRLTAPVACAVLVHAFGGFTLGSALGVNGVIQTTVGLNGSTAWQQGTKLNPISTVAGQWWTSNLSMWKLNAGDYLELKMFWTGTPAGPFNTETVVPPMMSLSLVSLPSVA